MHNYFPHRLSCLVLRGTNHPTDCCIAVVRAGHPGAARGSPCPWSLEAGDAAGFEFPSPWICSRLGRMVWWKVFLPMARELEQDDSIIPKASSPLLGAAEPQELSKHWGSLS